MRSPIGALIARPWFHRLSAWFLLRRYFPLSRLWAAAAQADGSVEKFVAAVPLPELKPSAERRLAKVLPKLALERDRARTAHMAWDAAFFGNGIAMDDSQDLVDLEHVRRKTSHHYMMTRFDLRFLLRDHDVPLVRWQVPQSGTIDEIYGAYADAAHEAFTPPAQLPTIEQSHIIPSTLGRKYWLRFRSPSGRVADMVYATVHEPPKVDPSTPSLIFGHGVGVENDLWRETVDSVVGLVESGIRVVELTGPWHGFRAVPGWYGGEPVFARSPIGGLDLFSAEVREMAVLADWCREQSHGRLGVGGISLGSLVAQLALTHAGSWPERLRPDAGFLVTHAASLERITMRGALSGGLGLPDALQEAGWTEDTFARWRPLTDPGDRLAVDPSRIVSVLASLDDVTPYECGRAAVDRWGLPEENIFVLRQGHFSLPVALLRDRRPFQRIAEILHGD